MRVLIAVVFAMLSAAAFAQDEPKDLPIAGAELRDSEFGVNTSEFGLDRRVEMYQWRLADDGFEREWNDGRIDSQGFAPGHVNPPKVPLASQRWWAEQPTLDGKPLDVEVLRTLGEWRVFRPNFSRLPGNLAATFQPEGDGLSSAENPLAPQIGDLRVSWRELVLPPMAGKVVLRDGVWKLSPRAAINNPAVPGDVIALPENGKTQRLWPWFGGGLLVIVAIAVAAHRRRRRKSL